MGKEKKGRKHASGLTEDILEVNSVKESHRPPKQRKRLDPTHDDKFVTDNLSRKILEQARAQQEELEEEYGLDRPTSKKKRKGKEMKTSQMGRDEDKDSDVDEEESLFQEQFDNEWDQGALEEIELDKEDEEAMALFMSKEPVQKRSLADIIMDKIKEKKTEVDTQFSVTDEMPERKMDERVVKVFQSVGELLSKYRSGKLPKAFKVIPTLSDWEEILYLTKPENWSAAAIYQGTRIFISNLNAKMAQRFLNLVLLPRLRDDIAEYRRLNYHIYMALKKALFKPAAFFKGILLPLCESGTCSLREAVIVSSVLHKTSIPVLHASAAMIKIADMDYTGANSIFLRTLLDKKYALPYRVIDGVVAHLLRFLSDQRQLPVLWHHSFLTFVQRYKEDLSSEQKEALLELCKKHMHDKITPEIRREIAAAKPRDIEMNDDIPPTMESEES